MTAPTTIDGAMMNQTQIDALIARLRHQKPDGRLPSADEDAAADALELLSASKPAAQKMQIFHDDDMGRRGFVTGWNAALDACSAPPDCGICRAVGIGASGDVGAKRLAGYMDTPRIGRQ